MIDDPLTEQVLGAALEVHTRLGAGLLESVYEECLCHELALRGLGFRRQVSLPIEYKGTRLDLFLPGSLIVEIKSVERLLPLHQAQLITYLKLTGTPIGLLINFNVVHLKQGIRRLHFLEGEMTLAIPCFLPSSVPPCEKDIWSIR